MPQFTVPNCGAISQLSASDTYFTTAIFQSAGPDAAVFSLTVNNIWQYKGFRDPL